MSEIKRSIPATQEFVEMTLEAIQKDIASGSLGLTFNGRTKPQLVQIPTFSKRIPLIYSLSATPLGDYVIGDEMNQNFPTERIYLLSQEPSSDNPYNENLCHGIISIVGGRIIAYHNQSQSIGFLHSHVFSRIAEPKIGLYSSDLIMTTDDSRWIGNIMGEQKFPGIEVLVGTMLSKQELIVDFVKQHLKREEVLFYTRS